MAETFGVLASAVSIAATFSTCLECYEYIERARRFHEDSEVVLIHLSTAGIRLMQWGKAVDIWRDPELGRYDASSEDRSKASRIIINIRNQFKGATNILSKYGILLDPQINLAPSPDTSSIIIPERLDKRGKGLGLWKKARWSIVHKDEITRRVENINQLLDDLINLFPALNGDQIEADIQSHPQKIEALINELLSERQEWVSERVQSIVETWLDIVDFNRQYDVRDQFDKQTSQRLGGTCKWIFQRFEFLDWLSDDFSSDAPTPKVLWIQGSSGSGKTVLCSSIVQRLQENHQPLAFFFSTTHARAGGDLIFVIRSWIAQLAQTNSSIRESVLSAVSEARRSGKGSTRASNREIWSILHSVLSQNRGVTLVLDGLDEYVRAEDRSEGSVELTEFLKNVKASAVGSATKILILSRAEHSIKAELSPSNDRNAGECLYECQITASDVADDIRIYTKSIMNKKLSTKEEILRETLCNTAVERSNGQFQWISCLGNDLQDYMRPKQLEKRVKGLPSGLRDIYLRDLNKVKSLPRDKWSRAFEIFRWITLARRPLTVWELSQALSVEVDDEGVHLDLGELPEDVTDTYIEEISDICCSLITIESRKATDRASPGFRLVSPAHPSINEFLLSELPTVSKGADDRQTSKDRSETPATQHVYLAMICLAFLNSNDVWNNTGDALLPESAPSFLDYASRNWSSHISYIKSGDSLAFKMLKKFFDPGNECYHHWAKWFETLQTQLMRETSPNHRDDQDIESIGTPLYYASRFDLLLIMEQLLKQDASQINTIGGRYGTPLQVACAYGLHEPFRLLMKTGADPNIRSGVSFGYAIIAAAYKGSREMVAALIDAGAKLESKDSAGQTALTTAAYCGHTDVVQILIHQGADCDALDKFGYSSIAAAADQGHSEIVRMLLAQNADDTIVASNGRTPLWWAAWRGHLSVVELLLNNPNRRKVDIDSQDHLEWTALNAASATGRHKVVEYLIDRGANLTLPTESNLTPLCSAATNGHCKVIQVFLAKGEDVNGSNEHFQIPLFHAAQHDKLEAVSFLLDRGADLNLIVDDRGSKVLHYAASGGQTELARILLSAGADVNSRDEQGDTPLLWAAEMGRLETSILLLDQKSDPNASNNFGSTPLQKASDKGHFDVVQLLLGRGADPNKHGANGWTPLLRASLNGHFNVVLLLLDRGADPNASDDENIAPLIQASNNGHFNVVQLLLDRDADLHKHGLNGWTPLFRSSGNGHFDVAQLLLDRGAVPDASDDEDIAPLLQACDSGHLEIVKLLLDRGADPNKRGLNAWTPLIAASRKGCLGMVQLLLDRGSEPNASNKLGETALHHASGKNHVEIVRLLLKSKVDINDKTQTGLTPLFAAVENGHSDVVKLLLEHDQININPRNNSERTPLFYAAAFGYLDILNLLLADPRVDTRAQDKYKSTPLSMAARYGEAKTVSVLLANPSTNLESEDVFGRTALAWASSKGKTEVVQLLVEKYNSAGLSPDSSMLPSTSSATSPSFSPPIARRYCDICFGRFLDNQAYSRCNQCADFDACLDCLEMGAWCLDPGHKLVKMKLEDGNPVEVGGDLPLRLK